MKVCTPTQENKGIEIIVYGHFGSEIYKMLD
jgi:hypothetical protein